MDKHTFLTEYNISEEDLLAAEISWEELALIEVIIKYSGFLFVVSFHSFQTAHFVFNPFKHQFANVNGVAGGSVEHRTIIGVGYVVEHGGGNFHCFAKEIFSNNNNG